MDLATATFRNLVLAVYDEEHDLAGKVWNLFVDAVRGTTNPYALLSTVGIVWNAVAIRTMAGDPNPLGEPEWVADISVSAFRADTGALVTLPLEEFAAEAIGLAAGWQWGQLNDLMQKKLGEQEDPDTFLHDLSSCLMALFIGVGGIETVGWRS